MATVLIRLMGKVAKILPIRGALFKKCSRLKLFKVIPMSKEIRVPSFLMPLTPPYLDREAFREKENYPLALL